jgi:hypothetical protein
LAAGTVIYRSKMRAGLKRNYQGMSGTQWPDLLLYAHTPDVTNTRCAASAGTQTEKKPEKVSETFSGPCLIQPV